MDDAKLVAAALHGDVKAFEQLVQNHQRVLVASAYQLVRNQDDAEDLAQEAFLEAYRDLTKLRDPLKFRAWLFAILRNKCYSYMQQRRSEALPLEDYAETLVDPTPLPTDLALTEFIELLPLQHREILVARYLHDLSYHEIAQIMNITEMTARVRCVRARAELRKLVSMAEEEERTLRKAMAGLAIGVSAQFTERVLQGIRSLPPHAPLPSTPPGQAPAHWWGGQAAAHLASWKTAAMVSGTLIVLGGALLLHRAGKPAPPVLPPPPMAASMVPPAPPLQPVTPPTLYQAPLPHHTYTTTVPPVRSLPEPPVVSVPVTTPPPTEKPVNPPAPPVTPPPAPVAATAVAFKPVNGFNLKVIDRPAPNIIVVKPDPPIHHWFAGKLTNLPVGEKVEIRIDMKGCDIGGLIADTGKWDGLRPVYTYADPEQYATYEWYRRDDKGQWRSGDPFKQGDARLAGSEKTPAQTVIPAAQAAQFLGEDGAFWSPWGEIEGGTSNTATRTFTFNITPAAPEMTIAIHPPYLLQYERQMIARLKAAHLPGVFVDELGQSTAGNPLYMIRVDDPDDPTPVQITLPEKPTITTVQLGGRDWKVTADHPTVEIAADAGAAWGEKRLVFLNAREHPSEHTGSWVVLGALQALIADTPEAKRLRKKTTWLLQPIYDPDGVDELLFDPRCDECRIISSTPTQEYTLPEVLAYLYYLRAFANAGWFFAASASFYCMECNEGNPMSCPFAEGAERNHAIAFNHYWFHRLQMAGIPAGPDGTWDGTGSLPARLATGCGDRYRTLPIVYEVNDRFPRKRLTLEGVEALGGDFVSAFTDWTAMPDGARVMDSLRANQLERRAALEQKALQYRTAPTDEPSIFDVVTWGY